MFFGNKKNKPTREHVLAAKPVRLVEDALEPDDKGGARLKVKLQQARWTGMFFKMPDTATKTFELDEIGLLVWRQCDGKTSVKRVVETVARTYGVSPREAEVSTFAFLQILVKKNLIGLAIEQEK
jgi:hypothetical protein